MEGAGFIIATAEGGRHGTNAFEEERRALAKSNILIGGLDFRYGQRIYLAPICTNTHKQKLHVTAPCQASATWEPCSCPRSRR